MVQENADRKFEGKGEKGGTGLGQTLILTQGELTQRNDSPKNENVLLIVLTLRPSKMYV